MHKFKPSSTHFFLMSFKCTSEAKQGGTYLNSSHAPIYAVSIILLWEIFIQTLSTAQKPSQPQ